MERSRLAAAFQLNLNMKPRLWFAQRLVDSVRHMINKNFLLKVRARVRGVDLFQRKKINFWVCDPSLRPKGKGKRGERREREREYIKQGLRVVRGITRRISFFGK